MPVQAWETCPLWPGQPITAHWGVEDPAAVAGSAEARQAVFEFALRVLTRRVELFLSLPLGEGMPSMMRQMMEKMGDGGGDFNPARCARR